MSDLSYLSSARYGKDAVRVFRVVREGPTHTIVEYNVKVLLEGDIDVSYTEAENRVVVATDSMKNITYYLAKVSPHILIPERFALHLGTHIVSKYAHIHKAFVDIEQLRWSRISVGKDGKPHPHSFLRDGDEKKVVKVEVDATAGKDGIQARVSAGLSDLLVLKSTGSSFTSFIRDEYTLLKEVDDRIFSTSIDLTYTFASISIPPPKDEVDIPCLCLFDMADEYSENTTLHSFTTLAEHFEQATLYKMAQQIITDNAGIQSVTYALPNKHYIPVDMSYIGVDNMTPAKAEVFQPVAAPSGLITATVSRK
ncbi:uricase [Rhodocollybia butyracea]|uniref:Uricase n=1 Tax=Rhodocollybia butyracea TaxID=206335 RepID=A0A9P5PN05_9AGAR|nr:uricase [Rhodocollybia butyracea]